MTDYQLKVATFQLFSPIIALCWGGVLGGIHHLLPGGVETVLWIGSVIAAVWIGIYNLKK